MAGTLLCLYLAVTTPALILGSAVYGSEQPAYSEQPAANAFFDDRDRDWKKGQKQAQEIGLQDGFNNGRRDFENRRDYRPKRGHAYKHGNNGYESRYGNRRRYREAYREEYTRGYDLGYLSREQYLQRERQNEHLNPR